MSWSHAVVEGYRNKPPAPPSSDADQIENWRVYRSGHEYREVWNGGAVFGPSLPGPAYMSEGPGQAPDRLYFTVPLFGTWSTTAGGSIVDRSRTAIYRDGELVCESGRTACEVDGKPMAGRYRVETSAERSLSDMSTKVSATWTFDHDGTVGALPIQVVRFDPELDNANTAPGGRLVAVPVSVQRNPGAPDAEVESLTVEVSYDDGKTWRKAPVVVGKVLLHHPKQGYVSLRAKVTDTAGDSVEQTIMHAYRLR